MQPIQMIDEMFEVREGLEVYTCGYGHFKTLSQPSLYKGKVLRVIHEEQEPFRPLFIQHTARTYPGQSGGPLLVWDDKKKQYLLLGIIFKNSMIAYKTATGQTVKRQLERMCSAISVE